MIKVLVETVSITRHRYVVEAPDDHPEYALDTVVCNEAKEVSQEFLDETIVTHRTITEEEYLTMFDQDNDYIAGWSKEDKLRYITQVPR